RRHLDEGRRAPAPRRQARARRPGVRQRLRCGRRHRAALRRLQEIRPRPREGVRGAIRHERDQDGRVQPWLDLPKRRIRTIFQVRAQGDIAMALMGGSLYDALKSAGVDEEKARKAAEYLVGYDHRIGKIDSDLVLLQWMVGANIALTAAILWRVFA